MADTREEAVRQKLQAQLDRMSPEERRRALEAARARLELIHQARLAGLAVETPEQIMTALRKNWEAVERQARSDD